MKKRSNMLLVSSVGLLTAFALAGCAGEKPVEVKPVEVPVSAEQKALTVTKPRTMKPEDSVQTGWTQLEDSIEISLTGPDNCQPVIEKASKEGKTVSIWLKDVGDDCTNTTVVTYSTIADAKDIETVKMYEAGYKMPIQLFKLAQK